MGSIPKATPFPLCKVPPGALLFLWGHQPSSRSQSIQASSPPPPPPHLDNPDMVCRARPTIPLLRTVQAQSLSPGSFRDYLFGFSKAFLFSEILCFCRSKDLSFTTSVMRFSNIFKYVKISAPIASFSLQSSCNIPDAFLGKGYFGLGESAECERKGTTK